jgi:hypothetical protein
MPNVKNSTSNNIGSERKTDHLVFTLKMLLKKITINEAIVEPK